MAAGAAQGYGEAGKQNMRVGQEFNLTAMQNEIRAMMDERIYERTRQDKAGDRALDKADRLEAEDRRLKHEKELIELRGREERKNATVKDQDPNKVELDKLRVEEAKRKLNREKMSDELNAAEAAVDFNKYDDPKDKAAAQDYLAQQRQGLLGKKEPDKEKVKTTTTQFTDNGEVKTEVEGMRPKEVNALPSGLVVGAATKQPDGVYDAAGKRVTIKNGKVVGIE